MKKILLLLMITSFVSVSCKKKGCMDPAAVNYSAEAKKDDGSCNYAPQIVLIGGDVTISVGDTYTDAGATAYNKDGSIVTVIVDQTAVNTSQKGVYQVIYSATNEHGTTTAIRNVNVVIGQGNWLGTWTVSSDCGTSFPLNSTPDITAGAGSSDIVIDGMFSISIPPIPVILPSGLNIASGGTANATVDEAGNITMPNQVYDIAGIGSITYSGSGTMNGTGTQFVVNYTFNNTLPGIGGSGNCTATYVK